MNSRARLITGIAILLAAGFARLPVEQRLTEDFRRQGLLSEPLDIGLRDRLGQNSSAVALAGLRTLVATFTHLQATDAMTKQRWHEVEDAMETTVRLAPQSTYYWDIGSWHMAYNASSYYRSGGSPLPPLRAKAESQRWIAKGRDFLERGGRNNPNDWRIHARLGLLLSDTLRTPDPEAAAAAFSRAIATGDAPSSIERYRLYAEARSGKHPAKTLKEILRLLEQPSNRVPTLLGLRYSLEYRLSEPEDPLALVLDIFGSEEKALRNLGPYFTDVRDSFPLTGVETAIRILQARKGIPPDAPRSFIHQREKLLDLHGLAP